MNRKIGIIGAGQGSMVLACLLLRHGGYDVTIYSDKTSEQIKNGFITSSQALFPSALAIERQAGLNCYEDIAPCNTGVAFHQIDPVYRTPVVSWQGKLKHYFQAVDQRMKFSKWLDVFQKQGGHLVTQAVTPASLSVLSTQHDLLIGATGKGAFSTLFKRNEARSMFSKPMRKLGLIYVKGLTGGSNPNGVTANFVPGVGEYFIMPGLTLSGDCHMMLFEGVPGAAFDCWDDIKTPTSMLEKAQQLLKEYIPTEYERTIHGITISDEKAMLKGCYTPAVRHPVISLENGRSLLGLGDAVVLNDPVTGQGGNNATKAAQIYFNEIISRKDADFDVSWMQATFEKYWDYVAFPTMWTNSNLMEPMPHIQYLLSQASLYPELANKLAKAFDNPNKLASWTKDKSEIEKVVKLVAARQALSAASPRQHPNQRMVPVSYETRSR